MYFADRVRETTTKSGAITTSSTITLLGAVAQYLAFADRVITGDQCEAVILDAGGSVWLSFLGTLTNSSTLTIDMLLDGSAGRGTGVTLTSGTHRIFLSPTADTTNKLFRVDDLMVDYIARGLVPSTSVSLTSSISAGVAYVMAQRVQKAVTSNTYTASKDTYVDLSSTGAYTFVAVNNGASAPALTSNSLRIAKVVSSGSAVTSVVTSGVDGANGTGNPVGNKVARAYCRLYTETGQTVNASTNAAGVFGSASTVENNSGMHSESSNNTRVTIAVGGLYDVRGFVQWNNLSSAGVVYTQLAVNGSELRYAETGTYVVATTFPVVQAAALIQLSSSDYIELWIANSTTSNETTYATGITVLRAA